MAGRLILGVMKGGHPHPVPALNHMGSHLLTVPKSTRTLGKSLPLKSRIPSNPHLDQVGFLPIHTRST